MTCYRVQRTWYLTWDFFINQILTLNVGCQLARSLRSFIHNFKATLSEANWMFFPTPTNRQQWQTTEWANIWSVIREFLCWTVTKQRRMRVSVKIVNNVDVLFCMCYETLALKLFLKRFFCTFVELTRSEVEKLMFWFCSRGLLSDGVIIEGGGVIEGW